MKSSAPLRLLAAALCLSLLLSGCTTPPAKPTEITGPSGTTESTRPISAAPAPSLKDEQIVTMGAAADYLLAAAARYNQNSPSRTELLDNFLGLQEGDAAPRIQLLVMVHTAFGDLPEPVGNNARLAPQNVDLTDVPEWAKAGLEQLNAAGVLAQSDLTAPQSSGVEGEAPNTMADAEASASDTAAGGAEQDMASDPAPQAAPAGDEAADDIQGVDVPSGNDATPTEPIDLEATMTGMELKRVVRRIYALYGTELKDDFYATVNKNSLDSKPIPAGETDAGGTYDQNLLVQNQVNTIIKEIVEGSGYTSGSMEEKIQQYYQSAVDMDKRNALGAEPLRKYLDAIDSASNLQELTDAQILALRETGSGGLLMLVYMADARDTQKSAASLMPPIEPLAFGDSDKLQIRLLVLSGEREEEAAAHVQAYRDLEKALEAYMPSPDDYLDPAKSTKYMNLEELQSMLPGMDVKAILQANGDELPAEIALLSPSLFAGFGELMQDPAHLPAIKTALKLNLLTANYTSLSQSFLEAFDVYNQETMGQAPSENTPEEIAYAMVNNDLGSYIDRLYAQRYFSPQAKEAVEDMVKQFIQVYKERIQKLDWMGDATKQAAIRKLDTMKFFIGYPEQWDDTLDSLEITDSFFDNQVAIRKLNNQRNREEAAAKNRGEMENYMKIPVSTVNAYYDQFNNAMCFPAGILQAPAFDVNASFEENLGGIGATIAHEISHAFDNNGAKFDENGRQNDWWDAADYAKFQELCSKVVAFYDGWESAAGISIHGSQTLGENIADIGAMSCVLDVLKKAERPDYDKFFRAYATGWLKCTTRERLESLASVDEHSPSNLRVNRVLSNFQEFYDTYDIQAGDGMYVAPADRISIW